MQVSVLTRCVLATYRSTGSSLIRTAFYGVLEYAKIAWQLPSLNTKRKRVSLTKEGLVELCAGRFAIKRLPRADGAFIVETPLLECLVRS